MKLRSRPVPAWARKLIKEICAEERIVEPKVTWQIRPASVGASGEAWAYNIRLTVGGDRKAAKEALIHELCHSIMGQKARYGGNTGHSAEFYALLFTIGKRHHVGAAYIKTRETWYKPRGVKQGYALYLRRMREGKDEPAILTDQQWLAKLDAI